MSALTNFGEDLLLDWMFTTDSVTRPTAWYVALHTGDPGEVGTTDELTTGTDADYVRKSVTFASAVSGQALSASAVSWTAAAGATTYVITHVSIRDALTSGNVLMKGELLVPVTMNASDSFTIAIGDLVAALD